MPTLIYSPDVQIIVQTVKHGNVDVSDDLLNGTIQLTGDGSGLHRLNFQMSNPRRQYDGIFMPNDLVTVRAKRLKWMTIMTGYLNTVPFFSFYPRNVSLSATCTLKKVQFWKWDLGAADTVALLQSTGQLPPDQLQQSITDRVIAVLTKVTNWPQDRIHIASIPPDWATKLSDLRTALGPKIDWTAATDQFLGTGSTIAGGTAGTPSSPSTFGGSPTTPAEGDGTGYLPWVSGQGTFYGASFDAGGSNADTNSALGVNVGINPDDGTKIGFGDYAGGWWAAYRMPYVSAEKIPPHPPSTQYWWKSVPFLSPAQQKVAATWWAKQRILVINPSTGKAACIRFTDWGPEAGDGRFFDCSHKLMAHLTNGALNNPQLVCQFASANTPIGPYTLTSNLLDKAKAVQNNPAGDGAGPPAGGTATPVQSPSGIGKASGNFFFPVVGMSIADCVSSFNQPRSGGRIHAGIDIIFKAGIPGYPNPDIIVVSTGVLKMEQNNLGGVACHITLPDGTWDYYAHFLPGSLQTAIPNGGTIQAGSFLGKGDHSGTTVNHLHFSHNNPGSNPSGKYGGENPTEDPFQYLTNGPGGSAATPVTQSNTPTGASVGTSPLYGQPQQYQPTQEGLVYGGLRALLNDTDVLPFVQQLIGASQRVSCAAPNGDFIAWFPDYFDLYGYLGKMVVKDIEVLDAGIDWNDETFITHQFTASAYVIDPTSGTGSIAADGAGTEAVLAHTAGIATIEFPEIMQALFNVGSIPDSSPLAIFKDAQAMLKRFGVRTNFQTLTSTSSHDGTGRMVLDFWYAIFLFAQRWTDQFSVNVPLTWMPEVFPGMHLVFESLGIQVYVEGVTHSFDFQSGSFTTDVQAKVPSKSDGTGFFIPTNYKGK